MKILMVFTSKFHYTGITSVVMNYYREMINDSELKIDFVVPNEIAQEFQEEFKKNNTKLCIIPMRIRRKNPILYIIKLSNFIKHEKYDIVHVHGSSAIMSIDLFAALLAGTKVRIAHSHNTVTEHKTLHNILKPFFNILYTHAFACGKNAGKWLYKNKEFYIMPNGQNIEKFKFDEDMRNLYRTKYNLESKIVIGHVGAFNNQKNHEFLIDVFSKLHQINNNYYLVLIGEGVLFEDIKKKVKDMKLEQCVLFIGRSTVVNEWLNAMDLMLLPSKYEGLPNVLVEWQISGLPCVISDNITKEVEITPLVHFLSLSQGEDEWAKYINNLEIPDRNSVEKENIKSIQNAGFDIKTNAINLKNKYLEMIK